MKNTIYYKVVDKETRYGSNMWGYLSMTIGSSPAEKKIKKLFQSYRMLKPFFPRYTKGSTIIAPAGTIGIMVFKNFLDAESFMISYFRGREANIIRVQSRNVEKRKNAIFRGCMELSGMRKLVNLRSKDHFATYGPTGTVSLKRVKVLD